LVIYKKGRQDIKIIITIRELKVWWDRIGAIVRTWQRILASHNKLLTVVISIIKFLPSNMKSFKWLNNSISNNKLWCWTPITKLRFQCQKWCLLKTLTITLSTSSRCYSKITICISSNRCNRINRCSISRIYSRSRITTTIRFLKSVQAVDKKLWAISWLSVRRPMTWGAHLYPLSP